ncbi:MAG TPA: family 16 glycoside hydrolase [Steroidobacteraceae bacterium]|nr:family 16 glycoside hydrolase [Steroidobacteraceae bacterium]
MRTLLVGIAALGVLGLAHAHPLVIEESSKISPPPGVDYFWGDVALDGNEAVALSDYSYPDPNNESYITITSAWLYRRSGTTWTLVRKIGESDDNSYDDATNHNPIAMKNGLLALAFEPMYILERVNGDWVPKLVGPPPGQPVARHEPVRDVEIDGGRIFIGDGSWGGTVYEKDSATGNWMARATLAGDYSGDNDNSVGGDVAISPNWAAVSSPYNIDQLSEPAIQVFQRMGSSWPLDARLTPEPGHTFGGVAIRDDALFTGDYSRFGISVWRRSGPNAWYRADSLRTAGDFQPEAFFSSFGGGDMLVRSDPWVFATRWNADRGAAVVNVFEKDVNGFYHHVAILAAKDGNDLSGSISVSGRNVLVAGENGPYYFELPTSFAQPSLFQDTFASGNGSGWTALPGSQFSVVQSGDTRVFRQASTAGEAGAVLDAYDWTNQSIEADVKPTAVSGNDRWVGLATRRTDASNYYYVTLRSSGIIQLKRMQGGAFATIDSASLPFALNRTYRLRLESVGTLQRVYVDGNLVLEAWDDALSHGRAALLSYKASVDYDNVILSPHLTQTIYAASEGLVYNPPMLQPEPWSYQGSGQWSWQSGGPGDVRFNQASTADVARAVVGPEQIINTDQMLQARVRPRAFNPGGSPWFGVMVRYTDQNNYVYITLRKSNTVTLRKLVNGSIVELGAATLTVTPNTWYTVRLEAVGSRLRTYVNGRLVLEATDPQPVSGRVGLVTYRTAADFDDIRAVVP